MTAYSADKLKNVCIAGHGTSGKTTLVESMMLNMGAISRLGSVENGNTISDFTEEEINRGISISTAVCSAEYKKHMITVVDIPGYFDFCGELYSALPFTETVLLQVKGSSGLDVGTEKAFALAKQYQKSIAFFVNEIDKENIEIDNILSGIESGLGITVAPITFPVSTGQATNSIIDILSGKVIKYADGKRVSESDLPADKADIVQEMKLKLMESVAESDETLMQKYFDQGELSNEEIKAGLVKAFTSGSVYPIFFGAPKLGIGVDILVDAIVDFFPTPENKPELVLTDGTIEYKASEPFAAVIFKVNAIPQFGEVFIFKVLKGELSDSSEVYNTTSSSAEKFGQLFVIRGKERIAVDKVTAGQIAATVKLKNSKTGDQLVKDKMTTPLTNKLIDWPEAIVRGAFVGESKEDTDKIATGLKKIQVEDASFRAFSDPELKQLFVEGLGELHLEVLTKKLRNQFKLNVKIEEPRIPYRETIRGTADVSYRHKKQSGGAGQFAEVHIKIEPCPEGFEFVNEIVGGVISGRFIPAVEKGIREVLTEGVVSGCKFINCRVRLYYGKEHDVDSNEMAFKIAGAMAFKDAVSKAKPILLEPIYNVEITVPDEYAGSIMGDISSRRGKPQGMESRGKCQVVKAQVPLKEIHGYSTQLRSMTNGRGLYTISFSHYDPVPAEIQTKIIDEYQKSRAKEQ